MQAPLPAALTSLLDRKGLRPIVVTDLGRDALLFTRYRIILLDAEAVRDRSTSVADWLTTG